MSDSFDGACPTCGQEYVAQQSTSTGEGSPRDKYEFAVRYNPIAYQVLSYGKLAQMSEIDILYLTISALCDRNDELQRIIEEQIDSGLP